MQPEHPPVLTPRASHGAEKSAPPEQGSRSPREAGKYRRGGNQDPSLLFPGPDAANQAAED